MARLILVASLLMSLAIVYGQDCVCGKNALGTRIVDGREAARAKFPWIAALMTPDGQQFCDGSLINNRYIVTAAHCMKYRNGERKQPSAMRVALGAHDLRQRPPLLVAVERIIMHESYRDAKFGYDIALLKLAQPVQFSNFIQPICTAPKSLTDFNNLVAAGWGDTHFKGRGSSVLLETAVSQVGVRECADMYARTDINSKITDTNLCTSAEEKGVCNGDSGGPLMSLQSGTYYLAGIVSWGVDCGEGNNLPAIFTRVSSYDNWIANHVRDAQTCRRPQPEPSSGTSRGG